MVGAYRLEARLGRGGAGEVWRARSTGPLAQVVAVKRLRAGLADAESLRREAEVLAELDHPHIVRVLEVVDDGPGLAVVMAHARGGSFADLLAERGRLAAGEVVALAAPVADALASAHRRGVVHADVKPANVLFTSEGQPLLSDFGAASWPRSPTDGSEDAPVVGTSGYLAPERAAGGSPAVAGDVWALGVICFEALTGRAPPRGATTDQLEALLVTDAGAGEELAEVVVGALASEPAERPDASAFGSELRAVVDPADVVLPGPASEQGVGRGPETRTFGPRPPEPPEPEAPVERPVGLIVGLLVAVAVLVAAVVVWRSPSGEEAGPDPTAPTTTAEPVRTDCPTPVPPEGYDGEVAEGDLDGDGCPTAVVFDDGFMVVPAPDGGEPQEFRFDAARPGDVLLLGDWDCEGGDSPGFYRPATGEAFEFGGLAAEGEELVALPRRDTGVVDGTPSVVTGEDGCDQITADEQA